MGRAKMHISKTTALFKDLIQVFREIGLFRKFCQNGSSICLVLVMEKHPAFCIALLLEAAGWQCMKLQQNLAQSIHFGKYLSREWN